MQVFGKFWKVMQVDNASFQDQESFGKREVFSKWLWKSFGCLLESSEIY